MAKKSAASPGPISRLLRFTPETTGVRPRKVKPRKGTKKAVRRGVNRDNQTTDSNNP